MREKLAALYELHGSSKHHFRAIIGKHDPWYGPNFTMLRDLRLVLTGKYLTDHVWTKSKKIRQPERFALGFMVEFVAQVCPYTRGDGSQDFRLCEIGCVNHVIGPAKQKGTLAPDHPLTLSAYSAIIRSVEKREAHLKRIKGNGNESTVRLL